MPRVLHLQALVIAGPPLLRGSEFLLSVHGGSALVRVAALLAIIDKRTGRALQQFPAQAVAGEACVIVLEFCGAADSGSASGSGAVAAPAAAAAAAPAASAARASASASASASAAEGAAAADAVTWCEPFVHCAPFGRAILRVRTCVDSAQEHAALEALDACLPPLELCELVCSYLARYPETSGVAVIKQTFPTIADACAVLRLRSDASGPLATSSA
jgi:pyruvate/2-oxoglutarate dehydrogenase complex dihydrolipoamide acyltransferase (E2) component